MSNTPQEQPMFMQELNPNQQHLVKELNLILVGTGIFAEVGTTKDKAGILRVYAVPKWLFEGMPGSETQNSETLMSYSVEIPTEQYVQDINELRRATHKLARDFIKTYCQDGRKIVKEYSSDEIEKLTRQNRFKQYDNETNPEPSTAEMATSPS